MLKEHDAIDADEVFAICAAALFHDSGRYDKEGNYQPSEEFNHTERGKELLQIALQSVYLTLPLGSKLIDEVLNIIEHHEDITLRYPFATNNGKRVTYSEAPRSERSKLLFLFQTADSLVHAQISEIKISENEWTGLGIPFASNSPTPLSTWQWHESVAGNIRLIAKRAIASSVTPKAIKLANEAYVSIENYLNDKCRENNISYEEEVCSPRMREDSLGRLSIAESSQFQFVDFSNWSKLEDELRRVTLQAAPRFFPYQRANASLKVIRLDDLSPMSLYVIKKRIEESIELHDAMMIHLGVGLWDMPGLITFQYKTEGQQKIAPPLVEAYTEQDCGKPFEVLGLVDGLHRCTAAKHLGLKEIKAIFLSKVDAPLVPLPVKWSEITQYSSTDSLRKEQKRRYRYNSVSEIPIETRKRYLPSEENLDYFFYRDLKPLGSLGKRSFNEYT